MTIPIELYPLAIASAIAIWLGRKEYRRKKHNSITGNPAEQHHSNRRGNQAYHVYDPGLGMQDRYTIRNELIVQALVKRGWRGMIYDKAVK